MIKEEFVSFEVAKLLKEKGFNEPVYNSIRKLYKDERNNAYSWRCDVKENFNDIPEDKNYQMVYSCPTQQLAMRWLREIHGIYIEIRIQNDGTYVFYPFQTEGYNIEGWDRRHQNTSYEEAVEAALKYCLENLI